MDSAFYRPTFTLVDGKLSELDSYVLMTKQMRDDIERLIAFFRNGRHYYTPCNIRSLIISVLNFLKAVSESERVDYLLSRYKVEKGFTTLEWSYTHGYMRLAHTILYGPTEYMSISPGPTRVFEYRIKSSPPQDLRQRIVYFFRPEYQTRVIEATSMPIPAIVPIEKAITLSEKLESIKTRVEHPFYSLLTGLDGKFNWANIPGFREAPKPESKISACDIYLAEKKVSFGIPKAYISDIINVFLNDPVVCKMVKMGIITVYENEFLSHENMELE